MMLQIQSKSKAIQLIVSSSILLLVTVAGLTTLLAGWNDTGCKHFKIDSQCSISNCKNYAEFHCGKMVLNVTFEEFARFRDGTCWSNHENTTCSITKRVGDVEVYHFQYSPKECGAICQHFKGLPT
jgi:hypothetical protein